MKKKGLTRREFGIASFAVAMSGCGPSTPPPPIDLAVYGDCRQFAKIHRRIAGSIAARHPKAIMIAGDLVSHPEEQERWDDFKDITKVFQAPLIPAIGNHDEHPSNAFLREMGLKQTWYERRIGDFHVFVLDSLKMFQEKEQLDWFRKAGEASDAKHKFAVFHHPPVIIDRKRTRETPTILATIHPLLVKMKFCAGLCGHQHAFYYARRDGIPYVVTGGGGSALAELDLSMASAGDLSRSFYHFVGLNVVGSKIEGRVYEPDGDVVPELAFPICSHA